MIISQTVLRCTFVSELIPACFYRKWAGKINRGYFCRNWLIIIAYPDKKPRCRFAPFAFPMKTGMSLRSICNFAHLPTLPFTKKALQCAGVTAH